MVCCTSLNYPLTGLTIERFSLSLFSDMIPLISFYLLFARTLCRKSKEVLWEIEK